MRLAQPSEDGRDAEGRRRSRPEAEQSQGRPRARRLEHLEPLRYKIANNELEAKFCMPFLMASLIIPPQGRHPRVHRRVRGERAGAADDGAGHERVRPEIEAQGFDKIRSIVEVDLIDGRTLVQASDDRYRGGPDKPFTRASSTRSSRIARN